jgi:hypothetical protein
MHFMSLFAWSLCCFVVLSHAGGSATPIQLVERLALQSDSPGHHRIRSLFSSDSKYDVPVLGGCRQFCCHLYTCSIIVPYHVCTWVSVCECCYVAAFCSVRVLASCIQRRRQLCIIVASDSVVCWTCCKRVAGISSIVGKPIHGGNTLARSTQCIRSTLQGGVLEVKAPESLFIRCSQLFACERHTDNLIDSRPVSSLL